MSCAASCAKPVDAITVRQAEVEDDRVVGRSIHGAVRIGEIAGDVAGEATALKPLGHQLCQSVIVLDDKHSHEGRLSSLQFGRGRVRPAFFDHNDGNRMDIC